MEKINSQEQMGTSVVRYPTLMHLSILNTLYHHTKDILKIWRHNWIKVRGYEVWKTLLQSRKHSIFSTVVEALELEF